MSQKLEKTSNFSGIIAICRKLYGDELLYLAEALYRGGIRSLEVTYDQSSPRHMEQTPTAIRSLVEHFPEMTIGAGTVLTPEQVIATCDAGGSFIVSPNTDLLVIQHTKSSGMCSIPGAATPSEIVSAYTAGADLVKLFPAASLGCQYVRDICSPLSHIPLLATGGIDLANFGDFLRAGCCGAGIGGTLCNRHLIQNKEWQALTQLASQFCTIYQEHFSKYSKEVL